MAKLWRRRTIIIASLVVVLSIGIVFASIPYLPKPPHRSIQVPVTKEIRGGSQSYPGIYSLTLRNITKSETFEIGVTVNNGTISATFCVMAESAFISWAFNNQTHKPPGIPFSLDGCIIQQETAQSTLTFTPPTDGNWDVVVINTRPDEVTVQYSPVP